MKIALLSASPRPDGNSAALAHAFSDSAREAGHQVHQVDLTTTTAGGFLRDCRTCRTPGGACAIADPYAEVLLRAVVPADAVVFATPLYFYGLPAALKNFIDRSVCYLSASYPHSQHVREGLAGQRCAVLVTSEESYPALLTGLTLQIQEMCRYLQQDFVGITHGIGNQRGEVVHDPSDPLGAAQRLGRELFTRRVSDYTVATPRPGKVW